MSNVHKQLSAEQRAQIVRRHLADKVPVSDLADEFGVQPSRIHQWVKQVLDQAENAFKRVGRPFKGEMTKSRQVQRLEAKLAQKNEVIAELMEENLRAKKTNGEL
jgi:transposase-like protein